MQLDGKVRKQLFSPMIAFREKEKEPEDRERTHLKLRKLTDDEVRQREIDLLETRYLYWIDHEKRTSFWMGFALAGMVGVAAVIYITLGWETMASVSLPLIIIGAAIYIGFQDRYKPARKRLMDRLLGNYLEAVEEREGAIQAGNTEKIRSAMLGERTALEQILQVYARM